MPAAWLEKSMDTMKLLQARNVSKKVKIPQQSICEKFTYISFEQDSQSTTNFDYINRQQDPTLYASNGGDESESSGDVRGLAELPSAFWPQTSPHVMRDEIAASKAPSMKERLKNSPFGNASSILERNARQREISKQSQQKLLKGTSRLLKNPHPNKILRTSQRKKLYPSHPEYQKQQQQEERRRRKDTGPIEVPADTVQQKIVAEKLFAATTSRPSSAAAARKSYSGDETSPTKDNIPTSMDHLTYAERLQVMILQCQDTAAFNGANDEDSETK